MLKLVKRQRLEAMLALLIGQIVILHTIVKCIQRYFPLASGIFRKLAFFGMLVDSVEQKSFTALLAFVLGWWWWRFFLNNHKFDPELSSSTSDSIVSIGTLSDDPQLLQARNIWKNGNIPSFCFGLATGPDKYGFDSEISSAGSDGIAYICTLSDDPHVLPA
jgi:hypothetical protein